MSRRRTAHHPPILAYIAAHEAAERTHSANRDAAEAKIRALFEEQSALLEAERQAVFDLTAAADRAAELADQVAEIQQAGADPTAVRHQLERAQAEIDRLHRASGQRAQRLTAIGDEIEHWDDRRAAAGKALNKVRKKPPLFKENQP